MPRVWSHAATARQRSSLATAARQAVLLVCVSTALAGARWALVGPRLSLRADAVEYELELAAPLIEVAQARRFYDEGVHLFIDTRDAGPDAIDTIPGAFVLRPGTFDDDLLALLDIIVPEDRFILFGDGNLALANNVAANLIRRGYPSVELLKGGLGAWRDAGGPLSARRPAVTP